MGDNGIAEAAPKSAESIAVILTITSCFAFLGIVFMLGIQVYRQESLNIILIDIVKTTLATTVGGLFLYVGTKMKKVV